MANFDLTILLLCYNSVTVVERAVKSIYSQNTNYTFKVLAGEDCSTDGTADLIKKLSLQYTSFYPVISNEKSRHHRGGDYINFKTLYNLVDTEFFCILDADDYFINDEKIEIQINFLKQNLDYIACGTNYLIRNDNYEELAVPNEKLSAYSGTASGVRDIIDGGKVPFLQTSSVIFRQLPQKEKKIFLRKMGKPLCKGDFIRNLYFAQFGKIKFLPIVGSVYTIANTGDWQKLSMLEREYYYLKFYIYHMLFTVKLPNKFYFIKHIKLTLKKIINAYLK